MRQGTDEGLGIVKPIDNTTGEDDVELAKVWIELAGVSLDELDLGSQMGEPRIKIIVGDFNEFLGEVEANCFVEILSEVQCRSAKGTAEFQNPTLDVPLARFGDH